VKFVEGAEVAKKQLTRFWGNLEPTFVKTKIGMHCGEGRYIASTWGNPTIGKLHLFSDLM